VICSDDAAISSLLDEASRNRNLAIPAAVRGARPPAPADHAPARQNSIDSINKAFDNVGSRAGSAFLDNP